MRSLSKTFTRRSKRGFTQVEVMMGLALTTFLSACVADVFHTTGRNQNLVGIRTTMQTSGRQAMDRMMDDVQAASGIVASYQAKNGITYKSDIRNTIVLRVPSYDGNNAPLDGRSDYVIYNLVTAPRPEEGPYMLQKIVEPDSASARPAQVSKTIARNIEFARFTYLVHQTTVSNGLDLNIGLDAEVFGSGADLVQKVTVGGQPFVVGTGGQANIVAGTLNAALGNLVLAQLPPNNAVVDILYSVAPWLLPQNVNVSQLNVTLRMSVNHQELRPTDSSAMELTSSAVLRNR